MQGNSLAFAMTPERWNKIKDLFSSAQDCTEAERSAYLLRACGGDQQLRHEVEKLLHASREDDFLENSAVAEVASLFDDDRTAAMNSPVSQDSPPRLKGGTLLNDRYEIVRLLGRGGMGEVYLAADKRINRNVALKVLHADLVSSKESLRRFALEAQAVSALNHPHIMTIYEFDNTDDGSLFIAAEYIDGQTLNNLIGTGLGIDKALDIAIQVSSALSAAHDAGIAHRDIKPENIMVRPDGYIKVLDFGLAKLTHQEEKVASSSTSGSEDVTRGLNQTRPGAVMGTAAYMSPEQARGLRVDPRTDIWSLGVVIYEMLTGRRPFPGETSADIIVSVLVREPAPISAHLANVPAEIDWIVSKTLSKNVEARYQTPNELRADLEKIRKRVEFDDTLSRSSGGQAAAISRANPTSPNPAEPTDGDKTEDDFSTPSGFHSPIGGELSFKAGSLFAALAAAVLLAAVGYFGYTALFGGSSGTIDSLAVLPFDNPSGDPSLTYLSDGLSEGLIDRLSQLPQLKVISRNSSFKFRGKDVDIRDAATQLGARAVVTGSVSRQGDELVIRIDMTDATENRQLSGTQIRRKADNIAGLQSEIAVLAAEHLKDKISYGHLERLTARNTENSESFRYYLSGLVAYNGEADGRERALEFQKKAIELDPNFALAHAELAWIYWSAANSEVDPVDAMPKVRAAAEKALELDGQLAKAHVVKAFVHEYEFDWAAAEREYLRAIELSPNFDFARNNYAFFLSVLDRQQEALAQLEEQRIRDPLNKRMLLLQKGIVQVQARQFDDALATYREANAVDPSKPTPDFALGYAYHGKGLKAEAIKYYQTAIEDLGADKYSQPLVYLAAVNATLPEKRAEAVATIKRVESMTEYVSPAILAIPYIALGDNDKAIDLLERACLRKDVLLRYVKTGYEYDGIRDDPRFKDLMRRAGLIS